MCWGSDGGANRNGLVTTSAATLTTHGSQCVWVSGSVIHVIWRLGALYATNWGEWARIVVAG
jgi:hypothetical protein